MKGILKHISNSVDTTKPATASFSMHHYASKTKLNT